MTLLSESRTDTRTTCPCCDTKILPCPFCGADGVICGQIENAISCDDSITHCGGEMNFGHWCGENDEGIPAIHFVVEQWNRRITDG